MLVHPDQEEVFPLDFEPILNADGSKKNDCERNAAKRLCQDLPERCPHLKPILGGDVSINYLLYEQTSLGKSLIGPGLRTYKRLNSFAFLFLCPFEFLH